MRFGNSKFSRLRSFPDVDPLDDEVALGRVLVGVSERTAASRSCDDVWLAVGGDEADRVPLESALLVVDAGG